MDGETFDLQYQQQVSPGVHRFSGTITTKNSGKHGFAIRVIPGGKMFEHTKEPGLIAWERKDSPASNAPPPASRQPAIAPA